MVLVAIPWVDPSLAVATRPRGGDWPIDEMKQAKRDGVDVRVSCLTGDEEDELDLTGEGQAAREAGIRYLCVSIPDRGVPEAPTAFRRAIDEIATTRRAGSRVAVHCRQGLGRSPLVVASLLVGDGLAPDAAWEQVSESRGATVPETEAQRDWLRAFWRSRVAA